MAVLFDMDGLMIDSEPLHYRAYREILDPMGVFLTREENAAFIGVPDLVLAEHISGSHDLSMSAMELHERKSAVYRKILREECAAKEGLRELLALLRERGAITAVVSGSALCEIELVVASLGIGDLFRALFSSDQAERGKPWPDCYLLAAGKLGLRAADCLVLEDSAAGVKAAHAAGMTCFAVPGRETSAEDFSLARLVFPGLPEVRDHLVRMSRKSPDGGRPSVRLRRAR
jgi:HAD superfamily hydrolase (TIGR01509 family)